MERRNSDAVNKASKPKLVPILKKRSSFRTDSSPPKGVQINTSSVSVQEIIAEENIIPGSPTFERVMRDLSDNLKNNSLSTESSLTSIPDACEKEGEMSNNVRMIRRSVSCASGKKKKVRFPARQMSQSFTASSSGTTSKTKVQRHSSFIPLKKNGSSNSFKFISSNESYSHEEGEFKSTAIDSKASIFDLPDTKYLQRKLSYVSSTLSWFDVKCTWPLNLEIDGTYWQRMMFGCGRELRKLMDWIERPIQMSLWLIWRRWYFRDNILPQSMETWRLRAFFEMQANLPRTWSKRDLMQYWFVIYSCSKIFVI